MFNIQGLHAQWNIDRDNASSEYQVEEEGQTFRSSPTY
jgi:hypothetical protein